MAATAEVASTSRESTGVGCGVGTGLAGEGAEAAMADTDEEIVGRPK